MPKKSLLVGILSAMLVLQGAAERNPKKPSGAWSDACPCKIPCSCWRSERANVARCVNVQVYAPKLADGGEGTKHGPVFVLVGVPATPFLSPSSFSLFIDARMPKSTVDLMSDFFEDNYGIQPGTGKIVPIKTALYPDSQTVKIPGALSYQVRLLSEDVDPNVKEYLYPWLGEPRQWRTRAVHYTSSAGKVDKFSGTNALSAGFNLGEPEWAQPRAACLR
jgi:hypothetical protein